jgi:hypothetical protein
MLKTLQTRYCQWLIERDRAQRASDICMITTRNGSGIYHVRIMYYPVPGWFPALVGAK